MRKVVVTGLGCINALGNDVSSTWDGLRAGRCGIGPMTGVTSTYLHSTIAAQVKNYTPVDHLSSKQISALDRFAQFGFIAGREAVRDAGLESKHGPRFESAMGGRCAVVLGSGIGGMETMDDGFRRLYIQNIHRLHPLSIPRVMLNAAVSALSMYYGVTGPCFAVSSACSSANHAIAQGFAMIRAGSVDLAVVGGSEACITPGLMKSWEALRVLAPDTCRPFSADRRGLVIAEGAGVLVLESLDHARRRNARVYVELAGCGMSSDGHDLLHPAVDGAAQAMRMALEEGGLVPEEVDYINAHGTGTFSNDITETRAIHKVFGKHAGKMAVSSTKSMHGHALGAAGGIEAVATVKALTEGFVPPTINLRVPDPDCDLDYVPEQGRSMTMHAALSNSFAFGGLNAVLAFRQNEMVQ